MENDPKAFVFWLQGYLELSGAKTLDAQQVQMIKEHLALVLNKKTPTHYETPAVTTIPKVDFEKIYCKYLDPFENPSEVTNEIANVITALSC